MSTQQQSDETNEWIQFAHEIALMMVNVSNAVSIAPHIDDLLIFQSTKMYMNFERDWKIVTKSNWMGTYRIIQINILVFNDGIWNGMPYTHTHPLLLGMCAFSHSQQYLRNYSVAGGGKWNNNENGWGLSRDEILKK